ncbi:B-cell antigen receptor complex-associated protein alpha chain isoform X2 [Genypterus blacodes]|uniref:B-cell antigen receptor complex-associated protein alpha chain isoform X2 n=1 Tax=Genypterus blacodes TaxID=154954 RepID=UPI003F76CD68
MGRGWIAFLVFCVLVVVAADDVTFKPARPSSRVAVSHYAVLECCISVDRDTAALKWKKATPNKNDSSSLQLVNASEIVTMEEVEKAPFLCGILTFTSVQMNDSALYLCTFNHGSTMHFTAGTYLQVYTPIKKSINLAEGTKNKILTAEGVLLLLVVLLPSTSLLFKTKKLHELKKTKMKREEENIYQGLNLDECCNTYDQIERTQGQSPYEDVEKMGEEEDIELEKP